MERKTYIARLRHSQWLSSPAQTKHLEFEIEDGADFSFSPGQFISLAAPRDGKLQTRAYSITSAPRPDNSFALCLNRVAGGFFSNLLCDLLPGQTVSFHGPHGLFVLRKPLRDSLLIAFDTGIAPIRAFVEFLFSTSDRSEGREIHLIYGCERASDMYYRELFETIAAGFSSFHYEAIVAPSGTQHPGEGAETLISAAVRRRASELGKGTDAYICGLNQAVSPVRRMLLEMGWDKRQIIYERYD